MTINRFLLITFLQLAVLMLLRIFYFQGFFFGSGNISQLAYYFFIAFATLVLVRRLGTINYLEALMFAVLWLFLDAFFDLLITANFLGTGIFKNWVLWIGYLTMAFSVFVLHKKRHVEKRKAQHHH